MNHRQGLDRSQTLLFPERLEDYIAPENPVRFLDAFVAKQDLSGLGFTKARCAATGRPPYDPAMLLKLYLYGYLHRVRSSPGTPRNSSFSPPVGMSPTPSWPGAA